MNIFICIIAFLKNAIYGSSVFFTSALTENADVLDVLALRFLMSFVVLWCLKKTKILKINVGIADLVKKNSRAGIGSILLAALFEPVIYMMFETLGISMTTGITTAVILSLAPITNCIFEVVFLKEKTTPLQILFLLMGIVGVLYIAAKTNTSNGNNSVAGIVFLLIAVVSGSLYMVFSRKCRNDFNCWEITYVACILGMFVFNIINIARHLYMGNIMEYFNPYFNWQNMIGFVFLSIISTIVATSMNNYALARMQLSSMAAFGGVSTFVTVLIGVLFFNERLYYYHIIGFTLILIRMFGVNYISIKKEKKVNEQRIFP